MIANSPNGFVYSCPRCKFTASSQTKARAEQLGKAHEAVCHG